MKMLQETAKCLQELSENGFYKFENEMFDFENVVELVNPILKSLKVDFEVNNEKEEIKIF